MSIPTRSRRQRAKLYLRQLVIGLCGDLLRAGSKPFVQREETTLVIAPHQDDESLGCGGLIARKRNEGLPVHIVFITDGSASHPGHARISPAELAQMRRQEAMAASASLGVEHTCVHFLDEPDGTLNAIQPARREALVARLTALLSEIAPREILLPCYPDGSSEHDATFGFVIDAIGRAGLQPDIWQYPVWSWWNPGLLLRRWARSKECCRLPVEDYLQAKKQAIACYRTQIAPLPPDEYPSLPRELIDIFQQDSEFFFRYEIAPAQP